MNAKAKGSRAERRAMKILEAAGYAVCRSGASLGLFDVIAIGPRDIRCVQVKSGSRYASALEREQLALLAVPANVSKEIWRFPDYCKAPLTERL